MKKETVYTDFVEDSDIEILLRNKLPSRDTNFLGIDMTKEQLEDEVARLHNNCQALRREKEELREQLEETKRLARSWRKKYHDLEDHIEGCLI